MTEEVKLLVSCIKIPDDTFDSSFANQEKNVFYRIENYKKANNIERIQDQALPVLINIDNQTSYDIENVNVEISADITALTFTDKKSIEHKFSIKFNYPYILKSKDYTNLLLFDVSGFSEATITLGEVGYKLNNNQMSNVKTTNTPLLINANDLTNSFQGYRNRNEMQNYLLLKYYIDNGFLARGLLLKFMLKTLHEITTNRSFDLDGQSFTYREEEIRSVQAIIQIDIISKI